MNACCFPAAVITAAILAIWVRCAAPVAAQEPSTPGIAPGAPTAAPASVQLSTGAGDILKLARAKVSDDVTIAFAQNSDRPFNLTASEIVYLREQGVSDRVLAAVVSQPRTTAAPPQPEAPATSAVASAPQYVTPPATTTFVETSPVSSVYVVPSTPTYYSFYDPWPYWYDPWPYWYPSLWFGLYWGGCYSYYSHHWNNYCDDGHYRPPHGQPPPPDGNRPPPDGNRPPPPDGNPPPPGGSTGAGGQPGTLASSGRSTAAANRTPPSDGSRLGSGRSAGPTPAATPTSYWNKTATEPGISRASGSQVNAASSRSRPPAASTRVQGSGTVNHAPPTRPNQIQGGAQIARNTRTSNPTSVWTSRAGQVAVSRPSVNQSAASAARPSRVSPSPATGWNRPVSQPASRSISRPATGYQRATSSPSSGYRSVGSAPSFSRPSYRSVGSSASFSRPSSASSVRSMGSSGSFRGGGGFSGASAPRMSSGGGFRGGGGGYRGGGGGGRSR